MRVCWLGVSGPSPLGGAGPKTGRLRQRSPNWGVLERSRCSLAGYRPGRSAAAPEHALFARKTSLGGCSVAINCVVGHAPLLRDGASAQARLRAQGACPGAAASAARALARSDRRERSRTPYLAAAEAQRAPVFRGRSAAAPTVGARPKHNPTIGALPKAQHEHRRDPEPGIAAASHGIGRAASPPSSRPPRPRAARRPWPGCWRRSARRSSPCCHRASRSGP